MNRISDEELENFTLLFNKIMDEGGVKRPDLLWSILQELKERRDIEAIRKKYFNRTFSVKEWMDEWDELLKRSNVIESEAAGGCSLITKYGDPGEENGKCLGFRKSDENDEPTDKCMECSKNVFYEGEE